MSKDFITKYLSLVENTESPLIYKKWVALSAISAALQKKVHFDLGVIRIFPNLFVVLVGPPGARKSAAISVGRRLLIKSGKVVVSADATSREALIQDLRCSQRAVKMNGKEFVHSSLMICSSEFESFIQTKDRNRAMVILLTDLYDAHERDWVYRTKNAGTDTIPSVYLSMIAATTPKSLSEIISKNSIGSGFTARILFVYAERKGKTVAIPMPADNADQIEAELIKQLQEIAAMVGKIHFTQDAIAYWEKNYESFDGMKRNSACTDTAFTEWYDRRPIFIIKLSMIVCASMGGGMWITPLHIRKAVKLLEELERSMSEAFKSVGKSDSADEAEDLFRLIKMHKKIKEEDLRKMVWRDMDDRVFNNVISTVVKTGKVKRTGYQPVVYEWNG